MVVGGGGVVIGGEEWLQKSEGWSQEGDVVRGGRGGVHASNWAAPVVLLTTQPMNTVRATTSYECH